jgi:hypothetical protein
MIQLRSRSSAGSEQVVDTMISLTRLSNAHRTIIAGDDSMRLLVLLKRRGFLRTATPATCNIPRKQHSVGLIAGQDAPTTIEAALTEISPFLSDRAAIAILIRSPEGGLGLKVRSKLQQMGFRIEAGVRCDQGLVLFAYRQGLAQMEQAA